MELNSSTASTDGSSDDQTASYKKGNASSIFAEI
jgi:hypothetical protein